MPYHIFCRPNIRPSLAISHILNLITLNSGLAGEVYNLATPVLMPGKLYRPDLEA